MWRTFGPGRDQELVREKTTITKARLTQRLEAAATYDDLMSCSRFVRHELTELFDDATKRGTKLARKASQQPNKRMASEVRGAIDEISHFCLEEPAASVLRQYAEPDTSGVKYIAEHALMASIELAEKAEQVAGSVVTP
jgi:hypothetical protein